MSGYIYIYMYTYIHYTYSTYNIGNLFTLDRDQPRPKKRRREKTTAPWKHKRDTLAMLGSLQGIYRLVNFHRPWHNFGEDGFQKLS